MWMDIQKLPVSFVDNFHSSWIDSLYVDSTVFNYAAGILEYAFNFSQQSQKMNSLIYILDEIQRQGNLYGYYNEFRAFIYHNSKILLLTVDAIIFGNILPVHLVSRIASNKCKCC